MNRVPQNRLKSVLLGRSGTTANGKRMRKPGSKERKKKREGEEEEGAEEQSWEEEEV